MCFIRNCFTLYLKSCTFSRFFRAGGNLLYNLIPMFNPLFLAMLVLQNRRWRSDLMRVLCSCTSLFEINFPILDFIQHTISVIYKHGSGSIFKTLKRFLQDTWRPTLPIILITFLYTEYLYTLLSPPHNFKPYLKWVRKHPKCTVHKVSWLVIFCREVAGAEFPSKMLNVVVPF